MNLRIYALRLLRIVVCSALLAAASAGAQTRATGPSTEQDRAKSLYSQGMTALQKGDLDSAHNVFEKLVRLVPTSPEAHNSFGWVLLHQGRVDSAILQFNSALKLLPS